jgi:polysaccharide export outer membrane protein
MPAIGEIKASGLTPSELTDTLRKALSRVVKTPIVTVIVTGMTNYRVSVSGKGAPSGVYTLNRETTLFEFLCQLGSLDNADLEKAYLVRGKKILKRNFYPLFVKGDLSGDIVLKPGDVLFIPDNFEKRITIVGAVNQPTTIPYREGLTILDVILSAGGFTDFAKKNDVTIIRRDKRGRKTGVSVRVKDLMKGDLSQNVILSPGDFIVVKESLF